MHARVFVIVEGGLIQNVMADDHDVVDVVVVDYDTEGATEEELSEATMVPQISGGDIVGDEPAWVSHWTSSEVEYAHPHFLRWADDVAREVPA